MQIVKVTNTAPAKLFKDSWVHIRDAFRVLNLFSATHLEENYEDEFAELDGQLDVADLMARCTICKAKVTEFCGAPAFAAVEASQDSREGDRGEQVHDLGPWVLRARPPWRSGRWMVQLTL